MSLWKDYRNIGRTAGHEVFIETGTGRGETLALAAPHFDKCISIELDFKYYLSAIRKFRDTPNVHVYAGNSPQVLPEVIDPEKNTVFWLDAHYTGDGRRVGLNYKECPLLDELTEIMMWKWKTHPVILIDDAQAFMPEAHTYGSPFMAWPTIQQIREILEGYNCAVVGEGVVLCTEDPRRFA